MRDYVTATDGETVVTKNNIGLFFLVTIRGAALAITNPASSTYAVPTATATYTLQGTVDTGVVTSATLRWTNALTGASGQIPSAASWSIEGVQLGFGTNVVTVSAGSAGGGGTTVAADSGSNYGSGWADGSNQGSGFGPWSFNHTQDGVTSWAGVFIGPATAAGISGMGSNAFGFYANPPDSGANAEVQRSFAEPMTVGSTFSFDWGVNWDSDVANSYRGFSLLAGETELVYVNMGNSELISINGNPMFQNYGSQAMRLNFQYLADGSVRVWGTGRNGSETYDQTLTVPAGAPSRVKFYFNASRLPEPPNQDNRQMYVDNLSIVGSGGGSVSAFVSIVREESHQDSNGDGVPDYWYEDRGMNPNVPNQGSQVGPNGYTYWHSYKMNLDPADTTLPPFLLDVRGPGRFGFDAPAGGRQYVLQYTTNLMSGFIDVRGVSIAEEIQSNGDPRGYYRIRFLDGGTPPNTNDAVSVSATPGTSTFASGLGVQLTLNVTGVNIVSSTYSINGAAAVPYTHGYSLRVGEGLEAGQSVTVTLHGSTLRGRTDTKTYTYTRASEQAPAITHVAGTGHWVSEDNRVYINAAGYPEGSTVEAKIIYYVNPPAPDGVAWPFVDMNRNPEWVNGDWWNMDLGIQPDGTVIQFAIMMMDAHGTEMWDNNNGQNYTVTIGGGPGPQPGGNKPYSTNPTFGRRGTMTINGNPSGWTDDHLIAIDMANDDPRSLGSNWTMHEAPLDLTHLWAAWDDSNLYLAWQYVDVTDVIDSANAGGAGSGKISSNDGILQWIVIDTIAGQGATADVWGKFNSWTGPNKPNDQIYLAGSLWQGYVSRAVNGVFALDDGGVNYMPVAAAGIQVAKGNTFGGTSLWGVGDADDRHNANAPTRNFLTEGHSTTRDSFYEMSIPLSFLGITASQLDTVGIGGVMVGAGSASSMDSIPHDETTLDTQGVESWNSSLDWGDVDVFTAPFARIGPPVP